MKVFLLSRDTFIFLFFFVISGLFWIIIALNKSYETRISIPVQYLNTPAEIELMAELPNHIVVKVKDKGTTLVGYSHQRFAPLVVDFNDYTAYSNSDEWEIPTASTFDKEVKEALNPSTQILGFYPNAIVIEKVLLSQKRVPVKAVTSFEYARQYYPSDSIHLAPQYVNLYGYKEIIDTIQCVYTEPIVASQLKDTLVVDIPLALPIHCKSNPKTIKVTAPVEFYTEGKQLVPITVMGVPENLQVRTFPAEAEVTYMAGFSHFKSIIPADFTITLPYSELISSSNNTCKITLEQYPSHIQKPKVKPEEVQWIIEFIKWYELALQEALARANRLFANAYLPWDSLFLTAIKRART